MADEIEHKLLISNINKKDLFGFDQKEIIQGYFDLNETAIFLHSNINGIYITVGVYQNNDVSIGDISINISDEKFEEIKPLFKIISDDKYVLTTSNKTVARVRSTMQSGLENKYEITIKSKATSFARNEVDVHIEPYEQDIIKKLFALSSGYLIEKTRFIIPCNIDSLVWELDVFHKENMGLVIAEVEVPSLKTLMPNPPSTWKYKVITKDITFNNAALNNSPICKRPGWIGCIWH
jgi:CYTH domain-containing protein